MSYDSGPTPTDLPIKADRDRCRSIDWYSEGETRLVEVGDVRVEIRFVGRHGRRGRIAISAPPGSRFLGTRSKSQKSQ